MSSNRSTMSLSANLAFFGGDSDGSFLITEEFWGRLESFRFFGVLLLFFLCWLVLSITDSMLPKTSPAGLMYWTGSRPVMIEARQKYLENFIFHLAWSSSLRADRVASAACAGSPAFSAEWEGGDRGREEPPGLETGQDGPGLSLNFLLSPGAL